jgi:hypothetical protein
MKIYMLSNSLGLFAAMGVDAVDAGNRLAAKFPELIKDTEQLSVAGEGDTVIDLDCYWMYFTNQPTIRQNMRAIHNLRERV